MQTWSEFLTVAAGVLAAVFCFALLTRTADAAGLVNSAVSRMAVDMAVANIGALAAASLVALWPTDSRPAFLEAFTTWVAATIVLMIMVAPHIATPQNVALVQAAR